ncbi:alpha/beta fold hydrolase [Glacieibacterium sp.]|uniref:alpha/beta fold hydrolase n=1 Tax=Glacieibacterium sp. TaxID=2860237 RepID=UPI003AFFF166
MQTGDHGMKSARRHYVDGPFGQMHLRMAGAPSDRPPLLCFHMSPMSGRIFANFIAEMGRDRLAIAVDTPGFGMSDRPAEPPEIADYARAMAAVIDALGIDGPVDLMGYHTGSLISCDLARLRPQQVRRVILVSAPLLTDAERVEMRALYPEVPPSLDGEHLLKRWRGFVHHNLGRGVDMNSVADMFPDGLLGRNKAWWGHRAAFNHQPDMGLPEVAQPVLIINPGDDLQQFTPRAKMYLVNGRIVEKPEWGRGFLDGFTLDAATLARSFLDNPDPFGSLTGKANPY